MYATGIIRKIDELGRVAIPKELRRILRIKEDTLIEFYVANENLILIPYNPQENARIMGSSFAAAIEEIPDITEEDKRTLWSIINKIK